MKKLVFVVLIGFVFVLTGCNNDDEGYSLDNYWIGFGVVEDTVSYKIVLDDGKILYPVAFGGYYPGYNYDQSECDNKIEAGDRVIVNFTILDDKVNDAGEMEAYYVKVNSFKEVLTKGILDITEENKDSIGSDPIIVQDCWMANNLLNFQLKYYGSNEIHFINLVKQPGVLTAADQPFELELRHNDNGDSHDIPFTAFVSFKLDSLQVSGLDSVRFKVTCKDYDDKLFEYSGVYNYGKNN